MRYTILQRALLKLCRFSSANRRSYSLSRAGFDNYEQGWKDFKLDVPRQYNFSRDCFDAWASKKPANTALWWIDDFGNDRKYSYSQLSEFSKRLANGLQRGAGLTRGERVIVILPRIPEWWIINLACIRAGIVLCPGTTLLTSNDIDWRLKTSSATAIIVSNENINKVTEIAGNHPGLKKICVSDSKCADDWLKFDTLMSKGSSNHQCEDTLSDEMMSIFFTSGTTGSPKMTPHTHASYSLAHVISGKYWFDLTERDVMWSNSDTGWAKTAYSTFGPWSMGAAVFTHHTAKFDPEITLKVLSDHPITTFCTAPTGYRFLVQQNIKNYKMKSLSHAVSAAEPLNPEVMETWREATGVTIKEGYGQTETVLACGNFKCMETKPGSMGKSAPGFHIKIVDNEGVELDAHKEGNIAISTTPQRPVGLFKGYLGDEERTRSVFVNGNYITGDRGYKDEDGYVWFVGRADDVIMSAGYRIGPFEVESALQEHPAVLESAVVSSPDKDRGEIVKAIVVLTEHARKGDMESLKEELQNHVKQTTAPYKYPRKIEFTEQLPKTVSGKTRRVELREREWKQQSQ